MIKIENTEVYGFEAAIRGMRNPLNSWEKSDSYSVSDYTGDSTYDIGENDLNLMKKLVSAGTDHSKFMRMITVTCDIIAPRYWWTEFDTYKVGTVRNSCSTMHTIHQKEFTLDDFSHEHLESISEAHCNYLGVLDFVLDELNKARKLFIETKDKKYWWQIIQLLPQSYNQRATVQMNYQVLRNIYHARKSHKLDEWNDFVKILKNLPYIKEIIGEA